MDAQWGEAAYLGTRHSLIHAGSGMNQVIVGSGSSGKIRTYPPTLRGESWRSYGETTP